MTFTSNGDGTGTQYQTDAQSGFVRLLRDVGGKDVLYLGDFSYSDAKVYYQWQETTDQRLYRFAGIDINEGTGFVNFWGTSEIGSQGTLFRDAGGTTQVGAEARAA